MSIARIILGLTLAAGLAAPQAALAQREKKAEKPKAPKLTKAVQAALVEAQKAAGAGDNATALTHLRTAEAVPNRTNEDNYYIAQIKLGVASATKDNAVMKEAIIGSLDSGMVSAEDQPKYVRNLAALAVQANDWPEATRRYEQLVQMTPNDAVVVADLAKIYLRNKQTPQAIATLQKAIATAEAAGQKPEEGLYGTRLQLAFDNKLTAEIEPAAQALVKAYPSARNWNAALFAWRGANTMDEQTELDWFRLMRASGALTGEGEYLDYAQTAQGRGLPAESKAVLDEGAAKGVVANDKPNVKELRGLVTTAKVNSDRASLAGLEKQARSAPTGRLARATADGYLSHGDWAKAAELYRLALTKGGEDAGLVNLRMGLALAKSGDKAGAQTAFAAVGSGPRAGLSRYYQLWLTQAA